MLDYIRENYWLAIIAGAGLVVLVLLTWLIVALLRKGKFRKSLAEEHEELNPKFIMKYSNLLLQELQKRPEIFQENPEIGRLWLKQVIERKHPKWLKALMTYGADQYHFDCFIAALESKKLMELYYPYLQGEDDMYLIERLARSCNGRDFDGSKAGPFLRGSLYSLRDLTGSPDWDTRFFAYNLLVHSRDEKAQRSLWEGLKDPHPQVRVLLLEKFKTEQRESFYTLLKETLVDDPSLDARKWARKRIDQEFKDLYHLDLDELDHYQKKHVLALLDPKSDKDKDFAMSILEEGDLDLAQSAALFLTQVGALQSMFQNAKCADQTQMGRIQRVLERAVEVGYQDFFDNSKSWNNEGSLLVASRILKNRGDRQWLDRLSEKVFSLDPMATDFSWEIYQNCIEAIDQRGSDLTQRLKAKEIQKYSRKKDLLEALLSSIPVERGYLYKDLLLNVFQEPDFPCRELLRRHLAQFYPSLILEDLLSILWNEQTSLGVKQEALKLLVQMGQPYTLQTILENLPLLSFNDLREIEKDLEKFSGQGFEETAEYLLKSYDATIRGAILMVLPSSSAKKYQETLLQAVKDSYADVRIAAAYKLSQIGKLEDSSDHLLLLKDPVQRVRISSAQLFSEMDSKNALLELDRVLKNEEEVTAVRKSVVAALVRSGNQDSLEPLMDFLEHGAELEDYCISQLASRSDKEYLTGLIEHFRDASPVLREKLVQVFTAMNREAEESLASILTEEVASLQQYLVEIMEKTGFVESLQRKLSSRDPMIRRKTTEMLALIGTRSAFKGIVLASKDPDPQVRVNVTRALEKLNTKEGSTLLAELEKDPEQRVRRYTRWALERIKVKGRL